MEYLDHYLAGANRLNNVMVLALVGNRPQRCTMAHSSKLCKLSWLFPVWQLSLMLTSLLAEEVGFVLNLVKAFWSNHRFLQPQQQAS